MVFLNEPLVSFWKYPPTPTWVLLLNELGFFKEEETLKKVDFGAPSYSTIDYSTKPAVTPPGNPLADAFGLGQTVTNGIGSLFGR